MEDGAEEDHYKQWKSLPLLIRGFQTRQKEKEETNMEKVKVIFRKVKNPYTGEYEAVAFFPETEANHGNIMSYMHIGQHSEASLEFYWTTKKATEAEYKPLLEELRAIYDDCELVVKRKICYNDLQKAWRI